MTVDISALRAARDMARPGTQQHVRYDDGQDLWSPADVLIEDEDFLVAARNAMIAESHGGGGLLEEHERQRAALEAVLLFYSPPPWDDAKRDRWKELTGVDACTSKTLCDFVRKALGQ